MDAKKRRCCKHSKRHAMLHPSHVFAHMGPWCGGRQSRRTRAGGPAKGCPLALTFNCHSIAYIKDGRVSTPFHTSIAGTGNKSTRRTTT